MNQLTQAILLFLFAISIAAFITYSIRKKIRYGYLEFSCSPFFFNEVEPGQNYGFMFPKNGIVLNHQPPDSAFDGPKYQGHDDEFTNGIMSIIEEKYSDKWTKEAISMKIHEHHNYKINTDGKSNNI